MGHDSRETVIFSDMTQVIPESGISYRVKAEAWQAAEYTTEEFDGVMLWGHGTMTLPELQLKVKLNGWYNIYIGLLNTVSTEGTLSRTIFRLTDERYGETLSHTFHGDFASAPYVLESEWKCADMTDQDIFIKHPEEGTPSLSQIAYFKFVPLDGEEIRDVCQRAAHGKTVIALHDCHSALCYNNPQSSAGMASEIEPFAHKDFTHVMLEYYLDLENSQTNQDMFWSMRDYECYAGFGDQNFFNSIEGFKDRGENFYKEVAAYAHELGLKIGFSYRMNPFGAQPPWDIGFNSPLFADRPDLRCVDYNGEQIGRLSYAYSEVCDTVVNLFRSMILSGADGVHMLFCRGVPNLLYEQPLVDAFVKETGMNPFSLDEEDPVFIQFRANYFSRIFIERVRKVIDDTALEMGRKDRPFLSISALADRRTNLFFALDLEDLAKRKVIDIAVGYPSIMRTPDDFKYNEFGTVDLDFYASLAQTYGIISCADLIPRRDGPDDTRRKALEAYDKGLSGVAIWDCNSYMNRQNFRPVISRLGSPDKLMNMKPNGSEYMRYTRMLRLNGLKLDKYNPWWGL
ncbi:hypothetical protein [Paenibacillus eucommiae]|uniref:Glycosyl hydrolase-like 10 domain-containing protein n=1 Tax=Paenibacillus eucommiae TaxID=1355755 RepID=A0ABS4ILW8_9BACL|nr:hypothetical protein [Paenibacillus eucommiae]MBP1988562.1 hypothetical protein [Paenibacillus eucommiae]